MLVVTHAGQPFCLQQRSARDRVSPSDFQEEAGEDQDEKQTLLLSPPFLATRGSTVRWEGQAVLLTGYMALGKCGYLLCLSFFYKMKGVGLHDH